MTPVKMTTFASIAVLCASALPSIGMAQPEYTAASGLLSGFYTDCINGAGVNSTAKLECVRDELARLDRTVATSYRSALHTKAQSSRLALQSDQLTWMRVSDNQCRSKFDSIRPEPASAFGYSGVDQQDFMLEVAQCRLEEAQKRATWLRSQS